MEVRSMHFKVRAAEAAADRALQAKLGTAKGLFVEGRKRAVAEIIPERELLPALKAGKPLRIKMGFDPTKPVITTSDSAITVPISELISACRKSNGSTTSARAQTIVSTIAGVAR